MDFFDTVNRRRSIRRFTGEQIDPKSIQKALQAAVWAPNSSNVQTWDFYWVRSSQKKQSLVHACLNQAAARSASELIVVTANPKKWRRSQPHLVQWAERENAPEMVRKYYGTVIPMVYTWGWFNSIGVVKWIVMMVVGLFRPMIRTQCFKRDVQEVAIKSAALACENLVLALAAQDLDSCMMEGFDEWRVRRVLSLSCQDRVVMVVGVGKAKGTGTWGKPFRLPNELVIHEV